MALAAPGAEHPFVGIEGPALLKIIQDQRAMLGEFHPAADLVQTGHLMSAVRLYCQLRQQPIPAPFERLGPPIGQDAKSLVDRFLSPERYGPIAGEPTASTARHASSSMAAGSLTRRLAKLFAPHSATEWMAAINDRFRLRMTERPRSRMRNDDEQRHRAAYRGRDQHQHRGSNGAAAAAGSTQVEMHETSSANRQTSLYLS